MMKRIITIKWMICVLLLGILLVLDIAPPFKGYMVITLWALMMWMFELLPEAAVAMILPVLYILFQVAPPAIAFKAWTTGTPWITLGGLIIGQVIVSSGLVKRIAYKSLLLTGGSFNAIVVGLTGTCLLLAPAIPSLMAKFALMTPLAVGLCQVLEIKKQSRTGSALLLVVFLALWSPKMAFLTASTDSVLTAAVLAQSTGHTLSWFGWMADMFLPSILWTFLSVSLIYLLRPDKIKLDHVYLEKQYLALGKLTSQEIKTIGMIFVLLVLLVTDTLHKINISWIMMLVAAACFLPGIQLAKEETFAKIPFSIVLFLVAALSIGNVTSEIGVAERIIAQVQPIFEHTSSYFFVMAIYIFSMLSIFLLNPLAVVGTLMEPIANICVSLGYPPVLGGYAMIMGFNLALFPYEVAPLMFIYGSGYIKLAHLVKVMFIRIIVGIIFTSLVTYPYWKLIGIVK